MEASDQQQQNERPSSTETSRGDSALMAAPPSELSQDAPSLEPSAAAQGRSSFFGWLWGLRWFWPVLLLLIASRAVLIHGDPTDFPMDRNIAAGIYNGRFVRETALNQLHFNWKHYAPLFYQPEAPEFPFMPIFARLMAIGGVTPLVAGRLFSLLSAVLSGVGLFIIGSRLHSRAAGIAALWLYALIPFSIFMGRCLLPDSLMVAATIWSFVAAGAPAGGSGWRRVCATTFWLVLTALAKIPALFFAPAVALLMMQRLGWRRPSSYLKVAITAALTFLVVAWWYNLWHPIAGVQRLSAGTNNVVASLGQMSPTRVLWVAANRIVLALSLPGVFLALLGFGFLQNRRDRLPFTIWLLLALVFVPLTVRANTYWVYPIVPIGCLLGAVALLESGRFFPRLPLAVVLVALFWVCPSTAKVKEYLTVLPEYRGLRDDADRVMTDKYAFVYYLGKLPSDLRYFANRPGNGSGAVAGDTAAIMTELSRKDQRYAYLVSNHMAGDPALETFFNTKPILLNRQGRYVIFGVGEYDHLGESLQVLPQTTHPEIDLGGVLSILDATLSSTTVKPGAELGLSMTFAKGNQFQVQTPLNLLLEFIHEPTGERFHLTATRGGMEMSNWAFPMLQPPSFANLAALAQRMQYTFQISPQMPAGRYQLRVALLAEKGRSVVIAPPQAMSYLSLEVEAPAALAHTPLTIPLEDGLWRNPAFSTRVSWLGEWRKVASIVFNDVRMRPALPAGEYQIAITAYGVPIGSGGRDIWPMLSIRKPIGGGLPVSIPINSERTRTYTAKFNWGGPQDFLALRLANPQLDASPSEDFALYLEDTTRGMRKVVIEKIEIRKLGEPGL